jgi:hypothetical protein
VAGIEFLGFHNSEGKAGGRSWGVGWNRGRC